MRNYCVSIDPKVFHNAGHSTPPPIALRSNITTLPPPSHNYPMVPENSFFPPLSVRGSETENVALDVLSCGNSIGVISGESLLAGQHNNPFLSLLYRMEREWDWNLLDGFPPRICYDGCSEGREGHRRAAEMHSQRLVLLLMWLAAWTSPRGNLGMSREVMPSMMPVRLPSHFHNGYWSCWLLSLGGKYNSLR